FRKDQLRRFALELIFICAERDFHEFSIGAFSLYRQCFAAYELRDRAISSCAYRSRGDSFQFRGTQSRRRRLAIICGDTLGPAHFALAPETLGPSGALAD